MRACEEVPNSDDDFLAHDKTPMNLATIKNVPVVTLCWVAFFVMCFVIFLVLSLCSGRGSIAYERRKEVIL